MTAKEYLEQGKLLDQRINANLRRMEDMRRMMCEIRSPRISGDRVRTSPDGDAPFVKALIRLEEMRDRIDRETDLLVDLRDQIERTIGGVKDVRYRMLLSCRYLENMKWEEIGEEMDIGKSQLKIWHHEALENLKLPADAICVGSV